MYFRYHVNYISPKTNMPFGLFVATWHLVRDNIMTEDEIKEYWIQRKKSEEILPIPPFYIDGNPLGAVTWFKQGEKTEELLKEFEFYFKMLEKYGVQLHKTTSDDPGKIVYEDEYQIGAV